MYEHSYKIYVQITHNDLMNSKSYEILIYKKINFMKEINKMQKKIIKKFLKKISKFSLEKKIKNILKKQKF